ncbi:MAG: glycosyltransferase [Candidatus Kapaibacteriota bacterium]
MESAIFVLFFSSIIYLLRIFFFIIGFTIERKRTKRMISKDYQPFVSVIIPARDEEENIKETLLSFAKINYPEDKFEIVVVNDRSTDKTKEIVHSLLGKIPNLKLADIQDEFQKQNIPGKAGAIHAGVEYAKGEIIFVTDADCIVQQNWINKIVRLYADSQTGFVTSFTNVTGSRIFDKIQTVEWIYMHTMAMGGVGMKQPLGCYGNNLTFRKSYYNNIGGYKNIPFSVTEDLALQKAFHKYKYKIYYYIDPETTVDTKPVKNFAEYFAQHHRWARGGLNLGWRAVIFVLSSFSIWAGLIYFAIVLDILHMLLLLGIRILGDALLLANPLIILRKRKYLQWIPLSVLFFLIIELTIPFSILNRNVVWKGQIFKTT